MSHHPFGSSALGRRVLCPGSYRMEEGLPELGNVEAEEGGSLHDAIRACAEVLYGDVQKRGDVDGAIDACLSDDVEHSFREIVRRCLVTMLPKLTQALRATFEEGGDLHSADGDLISSTSGIDACLVVPFPNEPETQDYEIYDWKCGWIGLSMQSAYMQAGCVYAIACQRWGAKPGKVTFFIPRKEESYEVSFRPSDVPRIVEGIQGVKAECEKPEHWKRLNPDPEACRYCRARNICPALRSTATDAVKRVPAQLADMSTAQLAHYRALVPAVEALCKAIKGEALDRAKNGEDIPGWKLVDRAGTRFIPTDEILDLHKALTRTTPDGGILTDDEFWSTVSVSVGKLVALVAEKTRGDFKTKKEATESARDLVGGARGEPNRMLLRE